MRMKRINADSCILEENEFPMVAGGIDGKQ